MFRVIFGVCVRHRDISHDESFGLSFIISFPMNMFWINEQKCKQTCSPDPSEHLQPDVCV